MGVLQPGIATCELEHPISVGKDVNPGDQETCGRYLRIESPPIGETGTGNDGDWHPIICAEPTKMLVTISGRRYRVEVMWQNEGNDCQANKSATCQRHSRTTSHSQSSIRAGMKMRKANVQYAQDTRCNRGLTKLSSDHLNSVLNIDRCDVEPKCIARESSDVFQQTGS